MISIKGLDKYYNRRKPNRNHVLKCLDLELPSSGIVAIFGRSGCGKTTLLNCIGGLDDYSGGSITVDGEDIRRNADYHKCAEMGYIFQNYNLNKNESCYDNVADSLRLIGMRDGEDMALQVRAALSAVGMEKYGGRMPDTLSGGQQQRIAIARALVKNPRIILADEPTGNLDEENTLMIMELLSAIAKDRLVILVTHEEDLVEHYCHRIVELRDGEIVSVRDNAVEGGYRAKRKNAVYLGGKELTRSTVGGAEISYYGEKTDTPLGITVVNDGGRLYLRIDGGREVKIIDQSAETVLEEGVEEQDNRPKRPSPTIPDVRVGRVGRLFTLRGAIKSGYNAGFRDRKRGRRMLLGALALFAAAMVFICSVFGTSLKTLAEISDAYNSNLFYIRTDSPELARILSSATEENSGISSMRLQRGNISIYSYGFELSFGLGSFESAYTTGSGLSSAVAAFSADVAEESRLLAGRREVEGNEILISSAMADMLIENTTLTFLNDYDSLIGLRAQYNLPGLGSPEIVGVVEGEESEIYLCPLSMAKYVLGGTGYERISFASSMGLTVEEGQTVLLISYENSEKEILPSLGDTVTVLGRELTVSRIIRFDGNYASWLSSCGTDKLTIEEYAYERLTAESPELLEQGREGELAAALGNACEELAGEYLVYYYDRLEDFLGDYALFVGQDVSIWLWKNRVYDDAKYSFAQELYASLRFHEDNGRYPTAGELMTCDAYHGEFNRQLQYYSERYMDAMFADTVSYVTSDHVYAISDGDMIAMTDGWGVTDATAGRADRGNNDTHIPYHAVIRSSDPDLTRRWIEENLSSYLQDTVSYNEYSDRFILTPDQVRRILIEDSSEQIAAGLVTLLAVIIFMSVCMYFIMRSSLMSRIREIGIYRAIGVSRKNLLFRFLVESAVLASLTVMMGFILASGAIHLGFYISPLFDSLLYYPLWLMGSCFLLLWAVTLICGVLPVCALLIKTPSQILTKYDV